MAFRDVAAKHVTDPRIVIEIYFNSGTRYYSTEYVSTYKGKVLSVPEIRNSIGDIQRTYEHNKFSIILDDSDYEFRGLEDSETVGFVGLRVRIRLGFLSDAWATVRTLFDGKIYDYRRLDGLRYEFDIEELTHKNLYNMYPDYTITRAEYPNAHDTALGLAIPIIFGTISALGLTNDGAFGHPSLANSTGMPFICTTQDAEEHLVGTSYAAMPSYQGIAIGNVYKNGILQTFAVDYNTNYRTIDGKRHYYIAWIAGARPVVTDFISCDVSVSIQSPITDFTKFLWSHCGYVSPDDFNATYYLAALAVERLRGWTLIGIPGAIWEQKTLHEHMNDFRNEFDLDIFWDANGLICYKYQTATYSSTAQHYKDYLDMIGGEYESNHHGESIINWIKWGYAYNYARNYYYSFAFDEDAASQTKYGATFKKYGGFQMVRSATVAADLLARKLLRFKDPLIFESCRLPLKSYADVLADPIKITNYQGGGSAGHVNKHFQLRETNYDLARFTNRVLLEDTSNYTGRACILGDGTTLAASWAVADSDDRQYCYLCDSGTGQFADGEPGKMLVD